MLEYITNLSITLTASVIVAIVSAYVTVRLAFRRFRFEHWWARKFEEYNCVLEALHLAKERVLNYLIEIEENRAYTDKEKEEFDSKDASLRTS